MEHSFGRQVLCMKEVLKMIFLVDLENTLMLLEISMKDTLGKTKDLEMEHSCGLPKKNMLGNGLMARKMDMVNTHTIVEVFMIMMKEATRMVNLMVKENCTGKMDQSMKVILSMTKLMDLEPSMQLMEASFIKDSGKMENHLKVHIFEI